LYINPQFYNGGISIDNNQRLLRMRC